MAAAVVVLSDPGAALQFQAELLGEGSYGKVFRGSWAGDSVAIKSIAGTVRAAKREAFFLQRAASALVVKLFFVAQVDGMPCLVLEAYDSSLCAVIRRGLPLHRAKFLAKQMFAALAHLHTLDILHRDVKSENFLVTRDKLVIADFGLSSLRVENRAQTLNVVSMHNRAPELLLGDVYYDPGIDCWAAGCVLYEMLVGQLPWSSEDPAELLDAMFCQLGTPAKVGDQEVPASFRRYPRRPLPVSILAEDLLLSLLSFDKRKRVTAAEAGKHEWAVL